MNATPLRWPLVQLCLAVVLGGCGDLSYNKQIDGPYRLVAVDRLDSMTVCRWSARYDQCLSRIPSTVTSIGWDERFIVATRRLGDGDLQFYYIDRNADDDRFITPTNDSARAADDPVHGPFTSQEFDVERERIEAPTFSRDVPYQYLSNNPRSAPLTDIFK